MPGLEPREGGPRGPLGGRVLVLASEASKVQAPFNLRCCSLYAVEGISRRSWPRLGPRGAKRGSHRWRRTTHGSTSTQGPDAVLLPALGHAAPQREKTRLLSHVSQLLPERRVPRSGRFRQEDDAVHAGGRETQRRLYWRRVGLVDRGAAALASHSCWVLWWVDPALGRRHRTDLRARGRQVRGPRALY